MRRHLGMSVALLAAAAALAPTGPARPTGRGTAKVPQTNDPARSPEIENERLSRAERRRCMKAAKRLAKRTPEATNG